MTGPSGDWIAPAGSFAYVPDGLEPEWYDDAGWLADALHDAERAGDLGREEALREEVARVVAAALPRGESNFAQFVIGPKAWHSRKESDPRSLYASRP